VKSDAAPRNKLYLRENEELCSFSFAIKWRKFDIKDILNLIEKQERYRRSCINLIASENVISEATKYAYMNDFLHRYTLPELKYKGNRFFVEIEKMVELTFKELFKVNYVNLRPLSGTVANLVAFYSLLKLKDKILVIREKYGAHISHTSKGIAGLFNLTFRELPFNENIMNIDIPKAEDIIKKEKPKLVLVGASEMLFPVPLKELGELKKKYDFTLMYDAAHVLGLIAGKQFQPDITSFADIITSSTHKTFPSVQGGLIMTSDEKIAKKVEEASKNMIANFHAHRIPALLITALEMKKYGRAYARQIIKNAKSLAKTLDKFGFKVLAKDQGYTQSHQVIIRENDVEEKLDLLERSNIIASPCYYGIRFGTQEMTRFGMKEKEMEKIAEFIERVLIRKENPESIRKEVVEFRSKFQKLGYCFTI
jgi:glycine hydroxymethyltransferase